MDAWGGDQRNPITLNKYLYGNSDPVQWTDPSGRNGVLSSNSAIAIGAGLAAIGVASYQIARYDDNKNYFAQSNIVKGLLSLGNLHK